MIMKHFRLNSIVLGALLVVLLAPAMSRTPLAAQAGDTLYPRANPANEAAGADKPDARADKDRQYFTEGYHQYARGRYTRAAARLFEFLGRRTTDDKDYEWAEFFFGISLKKTGFSHAAVDALTHVATRKPNPKIVSYSLEVLESISREMPFDRDMLIDWGVCDQSYGFVEPHIAAFVHYYQGEYDWDHGLYEWGDKHFARLKKNTYYHNKYLFRRALREIMDDRIDAAKPTLKEVIRKLPDGRRLKDDARKTLARLCYETRDFARADLLYEQIEMNITEQAQNLMERSWAHYRMGNRERAMGLLYSFEAPCFKNSFTPEFYILKSFIYKDVCHYKKAMAVLNDFKTRYGEALNRIYSRAPLQDNPALLLVILNKPWVKRTWDFLELLKVEKAGVTGIDHPGLSAYLDNLYALKIDQYENRFRHLVRDEYEKMANEMLRYEEQAHLMEYEIGLDMFQRVSAYSYKENNAASADAKSGDRPAKAVYHFQGEFWNDELDDYEVNLPNKCDSTQQWDIFFK